MARTDKVFTGRQTMSDERARELAARKAASEHMGGVAWPTVIYAVVVIGGWFATPSSTMCCRSTWIPVW